MNTARNVAHLLENQNFGTFANTGAWAISIGLEPDRPDSAITIYDTGGDSPDTDEMDLNRLTFQVRVRARDYVLAYAKMKEIRAYLISRGTKTINSTRYIGIYVTSDVASLGLDDNKRQVLTCNFRTISQEV